MSKSVKYQPHIDGLRAIAVLSVLFFHIDATWLPGGFVGVDIFFVISGFLITTIISRELEQGKFTIANFYKRRIKRILPVYFSVAASVLLVGSLLLFPNDLVALGESVFASTFFVSNYYFYFTSNYFDTATELKPLAHTWSLSVEEQFYIFWPLVLTALAAWFNRHWRNGVIIAVFLVSLIGSYILSQSHPTFAYYGLITRTHELMIGAMFSIYLPYARKLPSWSVIVALVTLVISIALIEQSMSFPGVIAAIPCLATGVLIAKAGEASWVNRLLSLPLMVTIGLLSYSLYMWHWPVLAFMRYYFIELDVVMIIAAVSLIFTLSYLSRRFIETPFLTKNTTFSSAAVKGFVLPVTVIGSLAYAVISMDGIPQRYSPEQQAFIASTQGNAHQCQFVTPYEEPMSGCVLSSSNDEGEVLNVLLWGDSHAHHLLEAAKRLAASGAYQVEVVTFLGCPGIRGVYRINRTFSQHCFDHNQAVWNKLTQGDEYDAVILASNWANYPRGSNLADSESKRVSVDNSHRAFYANLSAQLDALSNKGIPTVIFDSVPNFDFDPARCNMNNALLHQSRECRTPYAEAMEKRAEFNAFLTEKVNELPRVVRASALPLLCHDGAYCQSAQNGMALYSDQNHLSRYGAIQVTPYLKSALKEAVGR